MREGIYSIIPLFWVNALLSIIVGVNFSRLIYPYIQDMFMGQWLKGIGADSIVYVCLNQIVIRVVTRCVSIIELPTKISKLIIFIFTLTALFIVSKIIAHTKLKVLIGKW